MSIKSLIRYLLNIQPQVIEKTTFVYPIASRKEIDNRVFASHSGIFNFNNQSGYHMSNYENDIFTCATILLGPLYGKKIQEEIERSLDLSLFYKNEIAEGYVVLDYINSKPELIERFYEYNRGTENFNMSQEQFKAYQYLKEHMLDIQLIDYDAADAIQKLISFSSAFTKEEKKTTKSD